LYEFSPGFEEYTASTNEYHTILRIAVKHFEAAARKERMQNPEAFQDCVLIEGEVLDNALQDADKVEHSPYLPQPNNKVEGSNDVSQLNSRASSSGPSSPPAPFVPRWTGETCPACGKPTYTASETQVTCESGHWFNLAGPLSEG
jgi:hypothetical protein